MAALRDPDLRDAVEWAYVTGTRRGEVAALQWAWFDPEASVLRVIRKRATKARKPRLLPVVGPLVPILERRRARRLPGCPWIFHRCGRQLADYGKAWRSACARAGCDPTALPVPHDMRRSAARNLIASGASEKAAMAITGHETASMFKRYQILDAVDLATTLDRLGALLGPSPDPPARRP